jgi:thiamine pyrophosphate-dependent acetolactate synthase large subunit-like protein
MGKSRSEAALYPDVEFSKIAEAFGIHAEKLTDPAAVTDALGRGVDLMRGGRGAMSHVRVTPFERLDVRCWPDSDDLGVAANRRLSKV